MTTSVRTIDGGRRRRRAREAGFTLVEALVAIVILVFGLIAITNLFLIAGTSNQSANHSTAAVAQATEVMEALKAIPFNDLVAGGTCTSDPADPLGCDVPTTRCEPDCVVTDGTPGNPDLCPSQCVTPGTFNYYREIPGVGIIRTRWRIVAAGGVIDTFFIAVRSESTGALVGGGRSRAEFTTFRTCTSVGCP